MEYIKFRLDPRLIKELNIEAVGIGDYLKKENVIIDDDVIIIKDRNIQLIAEQSLRIICDPYTGKRKWTDHDAELVFIKIDDYWYKSQFYSAGGTGEINSNPEYIGIFKILK